MDYQQTSGAPVATPVTVEIPQAVADAQATYLAAVAARDVLREQVQELGAQRLEIARRLRQGGASGADLDGLNQRIAALDKQIVAGYEKVAQADAAVAQAAARPGAYVPPPVPPPFVRNGPPEEAYIIASLFIVAVMLPISIAIARRIWKRGTAAAAAIPRELMDRLMRIEESVDSVAIEVERIGEAQRFQTNILIEGGAQQMLGAGAAEPIEIKQHERVAEERRA